MTRKEYDYIRERINDLIDTAHDDGDFNDKDYELASEYLLYAVMAILEE